METSLIVFRQTAVMFIYMLLGCLLYKKNYLTAEGSRDMGNLLVRLVIPGVILRSFCVEFSPEKLRVLAVSTALSALFLAAALAVCALLLKRDPVERYAAAYPNAGFVGIPLVRQALGEEAVLSLVGLIVLVNILQYAFSSQLAGEKKPVPLRGVVTSPIVLSAGAGIVLFVTGLGGRLPSVARSVLDGVAAVNSPLAMMVMGVYLAQTDWKKLFATPRLYAVSAVRLLLIPAVTALLFWPLPAAAEIKMTLLLAGATSMGANVGVYAQLYGLDTGLPCQLVALSTLLSVGTLPLAALLGKLF